MIRRRFRRGFEWGFTAALLVVLSGALILAAGVIERTPDRAPLRMDGTRPASAEEIHERGERRLEDLLRARAGLPLTHETGAVAH